MRAGGSAWERRPGPFSKRMSARSAERAQKGGSDNMISGKNFDLSDPAVLLRSTCGICHLPPLLQTANRVERALGTFASVGFHPAGAWLVLSIIFEALCSIR